MSHHLRHLQNENIYLNINWQNIFRVFSLQKKKEKVRRKKSTKV